MAACDLHCDEAEQRHSQAGTSGAQSVAATMNPPFPFPSKSEEGPFRSAALLVHQDCGLTPEAAQSHSREAARKHSLGACEGEPVSACCGPKASPPAPASPTSVLLLPAPMTPQGLQHKLASNLPDCPPAPLKRHILPSGTSKRARGSSDSGTSLRSNGDGRDDYTRHHDDHDDHDDDGSKQLSLGRTMEVPLRDHRAGKETHESFCHSSISEGVSEGVTCLRDACQHRSSLVHNARGEGRSATPFAPHHAPNDEGGNTATDREGEGEREARRQRTRRMSKLRRLFRSTEQQLALCPITHATIQMSLQAA